MLASPKCCATFLLTDFFRKSSRQFWKLFCSLL